jgi:hypothetical protein
MSKARDIADLGSNDVLDTSSSGIDVTGSVTADGATFDGYVTINDSVDLNGTVYPNSVFMQDSRAIVFGDGSDAELSWAGSYLNLNTKGNDIRIMDGLDTKVIWDASTERLGIGTSGPAYSLHVRTSEPTASILETTTADNIQLRFKGVSGERWAIGNNIAFGGTGLNFDIYDLVNSQNRMRIDSAGKVSIGESSGYSVSKFGVNAASVNEYGISINNTYNTTSNSFWAMHFTQENTPIAAIAHANDTSSPLRIHTLNGFRLQIGSATGGQHAISVDSSEVIVNDSGADRDFRVESDTNTHALFVDAGNDRVGIGTSLPRTRLDVRGTSDTASSTFQIVGTGVSTLLLGQNADGGVIRGQGGNDALTFWTDGDGDTGAGLSGSEKMRITSTGSVGIGTDSPSFKLDVNGTIGTNSTLFIDRGLIRIREDSHVPGDLRSAFWADAVGGYPSNNYFKLGTYGSGLADIERIRVYGNNSGNTGDLIRINSSDQVIINENSYDADFRVESDNVSSALLVDASQDRVTVGTGDLGIGVWAVRTKNLGFVSNTLSRWKIFDLSNFGTGDDFSVEITVIGSRGGSHNHGYLKVYASGNTYGPNQSITQLHKVAGTSTVLRVMYDSSDKGIYIEVQNNSTAAPNYKAIIQGTIPDGIYTG